MSLPILGPWYPLKIMAARVWLTWKLIKIPRVLNNVIDREYDDVSSEGYTQIGKLAPTNAEMAWEQPHQLKTMIVLKNTHFSLLQSEFLINLPQDLDGLSFYGTDGSGTFLQVAINRLINRQAQVTLLFTVKDGTVYQLPGIQSFLLRWTFT